MTLHYILQGHYLELLADNSYDSIDWDEQDHH